MQEGTLNHSAPIGMNTVRPPPILYDGALPPDSSVDDPIGTTASILPSVVAVGDGASETTSLFDLGEAGPVLESLISIVPPRPSEGELVGTASSAPQLTPIPSLPSLSDDAELPPIASAPPATSPERAERPRWVVPAFAAAVLAGGVGGLFAHRFVAPKARPSATASASVSQPAPTAAVQAAPKPATPKTEASASDGETVPETPPPPLPSLSKDCPLGMALLRDSDSSYCLDAYEVTVRQWAQCVIDGVCKPLKADMMHVAVRPDVARRHSVFCSATRPDIDLPVNCLPWAEADVHCRARGARLPTAREWLIAAYGRGRERSHPWGVQSTDATRANVCDERCATWGMEAGLLLPSLHPSSDGFAGPTLPGQFPAGNSPEKVSDLFGNVAEWTRDGEGDRRVVFGGSFFTADEDALASATLVDARASTPTIGFRCAADPINAPPKSE
jgi:formylglycine-generating enzyme required for sulfatase activity